MQILTIYPGSVNSRHIETAVRVLRDGGIIIYPTDTLYALGCDALNRRAIERLCRIKNLNPAKNLLSIVCSGFSQASEYARIDNRAFSELKRCLPGPYTFILPASSRLPAVFKGRKQVGIRIPDNEIALALAEALGNPILTTSVEASTEDELVSAQSLALSYASNVELVIESGNGGIVPSTIVDLTDSSTPVLIRQGVGEF